MKLKDLVIDIISILFIIPLYYLTRDNNIFLYTLSLYLYLILSGMFSNIDIYSNIKYYYDNKYIYSLNAIFKYTNISIIFINIFISIVIGLISLLFNNLFHIKGFVLVNIIMSLTLFIKPILINVSNFVKVYNFKKLSDNIEDIYKIINLVLLIIASVICFKILDISDYISICILYGCNIIAFCIVYLFCYLLVLSNKIKKKQFKRREERIDYKSEVKNILSRNINISFVNVIKYSYFYVSIIILYFILINRYGYSYENVCEVINNCYLYAIGLINIILLIICYFDCDNINKIKEDISNRRYELVKLDDYIIKLFSRLLAIIVIFSVISDSVWTIIFNNDNGYILYIFSNLGVFYIMYSVIVKIFIGNMNNKKMYISLLLGLVIKLVLVVPLISSLYRMGYNLLYGDMLSSLIAYFVVIILLMISNSSKCEFDFIKKFDKILNIIYYNIILCVILLLFTLVIPVNIDTRLEGVKVIVIYLFISFMYMIVRRRMKINERINIKDRK